MIRLPVEVIVVINAMKQTFSVVLFMVFALISVLTVFSFEGLHTEGKHLDF